MTQIRLAQAGSSPHTRGALAAHLLHCRETGIIPAYAGSTTCRSSPLEMPGDHPRIRGEHGVEAHEFVRELGIIPAYAGSTPYVVNS